MYGIITIPIYYYVQKPWEKLERSREVKAKQLDPSNPYSAWTRTRKPEKTLADGCDTLSQLFDRIVAKYGSKKAFGYRPIVAETEDVQSNGRVFRKYVLGDYVWNNFYEMQKRVNHVASGFLQKGE